MSLLGLVPGDDATEAEIKILVSEVTALHMREATFLHCRVWTAGESAKSEDGSLLKEVDGRCEDGSRRRRCRGLSKCLIESWSGRMTYEYTSSADDSFRRPAKSDAGNAACSLLPGSTCLQELGRPCHCSKDVIIRLGSPELAIFSSGELGLSSLLPKRHTRTYRAFETGPLSSEDQRLMGSSVLDARRECCAS